LDSNQEFKVKPKVVDSNEPNTIKDKLLEYGWQQNRLYSADYFFFTQDYKKVGIERKTVSDLISSIGDRLSNQFEKMCEQYDFRVLLIEGSWQTVAQQQIVTSNGVTQWAMSQVWNYIRSWQDRNITLELTSSEGHTIRRVNELYAYYQKSYHTGGLRRGSYNDDRILAFPTGCRGKTAANVLKCKSLLQVAKMSIEELQTVEGIGEVKAQNIFNHFRVIKEEKQERLEE
jgi:ERCC4-type nuclease